MSWAIILSSTGLYILILDYDLEFTLYIFQWVFSRRFIRRLTSLRFQNSSETICTSCEVIQWSLWSSESAPDLHGNSGPSPHTLTPSWGVYRQARCWCWWSRQIHITCANQLMPNLKIVNLFHSSLYFASVRATCSISQKHFHHI